MGDSAFAGMYICSSKLLLGDILPGHALDHSRPREEHTGGASDHNVEVGQGRGIDRTAGARAENA